MSDYFKTRIVFFFFLGHGGGWGYSAHSVEAIRFSADTDILLGGLGLFGGRGEYTAKIKVSSSLTLLPFLFKDVLTWFILFILLSFKKDLQKLVKSISINTLYTTKILCTIILSHSLKT